MGVLTQIKRLASRFRSSGISAGDTTPHRTSNYESFSHEYFQQPRDLPLFSWWTIQQMSFEPELTRALEVRAAPMFGVEFAHREKDETERGFSWKPGVKCDREDVAEFIDRQLETIRRNMHHITTAQRDGWSAGEITLKLNPETNQVEINKIHPLAYLDCRLLLEKGEESGVRVRRIKGVGDVDLMFPYAFLHNHRKPAGKRYGRSVLIGAYSPWHDKWSNGGALDVRRLFMHKDAYGGMILGYPGGETYDELLQKEVPNRDIARQIAEQRTSGGVIVKPNTYNAEGKEEWTIDEATVASNPQHILQYPKDLDAEMRTGVGVTDGVVDNDNSGGLGDTRSIAMQAFYSTLDCWMIELIDDIDEQVIRHLVALNFGEDVVYSISHKPFAEQALENQNATKEQNSNGFMGPDGMPGNPFGGQPRDGDGDGMVNDGQQPDDDDGGDNGPPRGPDGQIDITKMGIEVVGEGVLSVADMVEAAKQAIRMSVIHAPAGGVRVNGKEYKGGEFIPGGEVAKASPEEKETIGDNVYFKMNKPDLEESAGNGDEAAQAELDRRSEKRAAVGDKRKIRVKTIREIMDRAEAGDQDAIDRLGTVDNPNLNDKDRERMAAALGNTIDPKGQGETPTGKQSDGPKEGETNADGLVFRDGRWHRDQEPEDTTPSKDDIAKVEGDSEPAKPEPEPASSTEQFDATLDAGGSPREAAEAATNQEVEDNYAHARKSSIGNAGEDLLGSARHRRNEFTTLADAEASGKAEKIVTRKNLLKASPVDFGDAVQKNPETSLAMALVIQSFPPTAKNKRPHFPAERIRADYVETFDRVKEEATRIAHEEPEFNKALKEMQNFVASEIDRLRGGKVESQMDLATRTEEIDGKNYKTAYNDVANMLIHLANKKMLRGKSSARSKLLNMPDSLDVESVAMDVIEGKSFASATGEVSSRKKTERFKPADKYVKIAKREGGRDLSSVTGDANKSTAYLVDEMGMRGVQWGNSVTDDERQHHAGKVVEAFADLSDVTGLHPKDMSIDGTLGMAIGARGRAGASAHYEPGTKVINLTRKSGVGALAHEWGHALDNYLSGGNGYKSEETATDPVGKAMHELKAITISSGYRSRLDDAIGDMARTGVLSGTGTGSASYYRSTREIFARTFERFVQEKLKGEGRVNSYLAGLSDTEDMSKSVWPTDEEVRKMAPAFESLLSAVRKEKYGSEDPIKMSIEQRRNVLRSME